MKNDYRICGEYTVIYIDSPKYGKVETIIDTNDIEKLKDVKLRVKYDKTIKNFYIYLGFMRNNRWNIFALHRFLMNCPSGKQIDHINRNPLDNRKNNLRICTNKENANNRGLRCTNKSGISGISWKKSESKWIVRSYKDGIRKYIGSFFDLNDAKTAFYNATLKEVI